METSEIAKKLVAYCRKADWGGAHTELYAQDATSTEPYETPDFEKVVKGMDAIKAKGKKFDGMVEKMHKLTVSEPLVAGNSIAFVMEMDLTMKGQRMSSPEICVYQVKDGKIISEEFFV
jgi:ketosteroid isomerase-like protein